MPISPRTSSKSDVGTKNDLTYSERSQTGGRDRTPGNSRAAPLRPERATRSLSAELRPAPLREDSDQNERGGGDQSDPAQPKRHPIGNPPGEGTVQQRAGHQDEANHKGGGDPERDGLRFGEPPRFVTALADAHLLQQHDSDQTERSDRCQRGARHRANATDFRCRHMSIAVARNIVYPATRRADWTTGHTLNVGIWIALGRSRK